MIEKKRLEKLIEAEETIYTLDSDVHLNSRYHFIDGNRLYEKHRDEAEYLYDLEDLFESEEEAEWYLEFGNIERTEKLTLPTWEEVQNDLEKRPDGDYVIVDNDKVTFIYYKSNGFEVISNCDNYHYFGSTKENYIEACRLAKKLFLGEEV